MGKLTRICLTLSILLSFTFPGTLAVAEERVMVIGDSWTAGYADNLAAQFQLHGHGDWEVANWAVPGSTAAAYADDVAGALTNSILYLNLKPNINYVVVSLGGNDLIGGYPGLGDGVFDQIEEDLRTVVSRIVNEAANVKGIVLPGYDILKFDKSDACLLLAYSQFGSVFPWDVTPLFIEVGARQQAIANEFGKASSLYLWGTGQGNPGSPDLLSWSPSSYVAGEDADCVHLSETGYTAFTGQIYTQYFAALFTSPPAWGTASTAEAGAVNAAQAEKYNGFVFLILPFAAVLFWRLRRKVKR